MFKVSRAAEIPHSHPLSKDALPAGFPFLISTKTEQIVEPVLAFLCYRYLYQRGTWRPNTVDAICYDLLDWWNYLSFRSLEWAHAEVEDVIDFRNSLLATVSPRAHRKISRVTINRRLIYVAQFYAWAASLGRYSGSIRLEEHLIRRGIDRTALAHLGYESARHTLPKWQKLKPESGRDDAIRPLSKDKWLKIAKFLGPLPSARENDRRPSRDRLAAELAILTGMRVDEVVGLTANDIIQLDANGDPFSLAAVSISRTKGLKRRKILIPEYFVNELKAYISTERADALSRRGLRRNSAEKEAQLFLNHELSSRNPGGPASAATLSRSFREAVIKAGLTTPLSKYDPEKKRGYSAVSVLHTFHDLRHTFAVCMYYAEIAAGNSEPWKSIQVRLGHAQLQTTMDTYLRTVEIERIRFSGKLYHSLASMTRE